MNRAAFVIILVAGAAMARDDDRKSPPPLPRKERGCLRVYAKPRCIPVEREVLGLWGLQSGEAVSPKTMLLIDDENRAFLRNKLR